LSTADHHGSRTLLVTGGCGFVGSHLVRLVLRERPQWKVINLDLLTYAGNLENLADAGPVTESNRYRFVGADIAHSQAIRALFDSESIDAVANLAAETHVDRSLLDSAPFLRTNVEGTRVLLEAASHHGISRFLQVSTDEVYGTLTSTDSPFTEESPLRPNSPYAASKAAADLLARAYNQSYGLPVLITRCGNNYGPYQFPEKFLPLFITNALDNQSLPLYGDGHHIRDWIFVEDHARALLQVLESGRPGEIYNISAFQEETNRWMAERILALLDKPKNLIRHVTDRPAHDRRYALNAAKIQLELAWEPRISLDEGLRATIAWYRDHRGWWEQMKTGDYRNHYARWYGKRLAESAMKATAR
jgi:dTDP-glucose 4,6-dehydratase